MYRPELITPAEERQVLGVLKAMELRTITMHGQPAARCATSASTTGTSPGSWSRPTRSPAGCTGSRSGRRRWPASTRASSPSSWSPGIRRGRPSAGTATPPCSAPRWSGCHWPRPAGCASSAARHHRRAAHPGRPGHLQGSRGWWVSTNTGVWKGGLSPHQPFGGILGPGPGPPPNMFRPITVAPAPACASSTTGVLALTSPPSRPCCLRQASSLNTHWCSSMPPTPARSAAAATRARPAG